MRSVRKQAGGQGEEGRKEQTKQETVKGKLETTPKQQALSTTATGQNAMQELLKLFYKESLPIMDPH